MTPAHPLPLVWSALLQEVASAVDATSRSDQAWLRRATPPLQEGVSGPLEHAWWLQDEASWLRGEAALWLLHWTVRRTLHGHSATPMRRCFPK